MARLAPVALLYLCVPCLGQDNVPLRLGEPIHSAEVTDLGDGAYEVRSTGGDPYVLCENLAKPFDTESLTVFSFDYICPEGVDFLEVYFVSPKSGWLNYHQKDIAPAEDWTPFAANLEAARPDDWSGGITQFRIDFGGDEGNVVKIRNIRLRPMTAAELRAEEERQAEEARQVRELQERIEQSLIAPSKVTDTDSMIAATHAFTDGSDATHIAVLGRELDLATQLREYAAEVPPPVGLPPPMVVGEGASPKNHTVIRVLNSYGICETQFLAFPPEVRGGVRVVAGRLIDGEVCIAACPIGDTGIREVRIFSRRGNLFQVLRVPDRVSAPFALATGDFLEPKRGDEVAVACATGPGPVALLGGSGAEPVLLDPGFPPGQRSVTLSRLPGEDGDRIIVHAQGDDTFRILDPRTEAAHEIAADLPESCTGVYASAHSAYAAASDEPLFSHVSRLDIEGAGEAVDVGERENLFWFTAAGRFSDVPEGRYTRHSDFAHIRTDFASPSASDPDFTRADADYWAGDAFQGFVTGRLANYDTDPPVCWEPCFTHRWFANQAEKWAEATDEETGLPSYTLVNRENEASYYGEFGATRSFVSGTYAPGVRPIESFYTFPQRAFLHGLVQRFRANPEHFVAVEPNHEMEINADTEDSHGDYNPNMLRAFYRYLTGLYVDLEGINQVFGADFTEGRFDAPRNLGRGDWDRYSTENPYYLTWMRFMNYAIYRVISGTYREALLAGFPAEAVKCHQIPDNYAISSLTAFSKPARRITPIDWNLNAGVGYGFTRYGVWFNREHNVVQGAYSSGFDSVVVGEYQSLHPDADLAYQQLAYMRDHGIQFIHAMNWPEGHDRGFNDSLREALIRLAEEDKPRPGVTGGTGQVRAVGDAYDVVSIGTTEAHTGLLKSVNADGSWEGSVYVVPFHAHVDIEPLLIRKQATLARRPLSVGPLKAIDAGNLVEFSFEARSNDDGAVSFRLYHHGIELPDLRVTIPVSDEWRHYRCLVRVQIDADDLRIEMGSGADDTWLGERVQLRDLSVLRHTEKTTKLKKGIFAGERHEGGVTFDILP